DGNLTAGLVWTSSLDGTLGTGGSFSRTLHAGTHTVTARVPDSSGLTGSATFTVVVQTPQSPQLDFLVNTTKPSHYNRETATILVSVTDGVSAVVGASVSTVVTTSKGATKSLSGTTGADGVAVLNYGVNSKAGTGTYTAKATASKPGYTAGSDSTS